MNSKQVCHDEENKLVENLSREGIEKNRYHEKKIQNLEANEFCFVSVLALVMDPAPMVDSLQKISNINAQIN